MGIIRLPDRLRAAVAQADQPEFRAWAQALPDLAAETAYRWRLRLGAPFEPGGQCSWVAPVRTAVGEELVLKLGWRHPEALHEADALRLWRGNGAVHLHAADDVGDTSVLLLERCLPGRPLGRVAEEQQDLVIATLLRRLWVNPPAGHPFRPLTTMCHAWAAEFEHNLTRTQAQAILDPGIARAAVTLLRELPASTTDTALLCTDLHAENVLAARRRPWLVIDPKPYTGDRTYDPVQHLLNCDRRLFSDPVGLAGRMAHLLDLDAGRLQFWLFARCAQEALDQPALHEVAARLAP